MISLTKELYQNKLDKEPRVEAAEKSIRRRNSGVELQLILYNCSTYFDTAPKVAKNTKPEQLELSLLFRIFLGG